jgi:hypothetical protein
METEPVSETLCSLAFRIWYDGQSPKTSNSEWSIHCILYVYALLFQLDISLMYSFCSLFNNLIKSTYLRYLLMGIVIILLLVSVINSTVSRVRSFSSLAHPDRLLGPPCLQSAGCQGKAAAAWSCSPPTIANVDMWIYTSTGTTLPSLNLPHFTPIQADCWLILFYKSLPLYPFMSFCLRLFYEEDINKMEDSLIIHR